MKGACPMTRTLPRTGGGRIGWGYETPGLLSSDFSFVRLEFGPPALFFLDLGPCSVQA